MKTFIRTVLSLCLVLICTQLWASDSADVRFDIRTVQVNNGEEVLSIKAIVSPAVKLYGLQQSDKDILFSSVSFDSSFKRYFSGKIDETGARHVEKDSVVNADVRYYLDSVLWQQTLNINASDSFVLKGTINYLYKKGDDYLPGDHPFKLHIKPQTQAEKTSSSAANSYADKSLAWIFLIGFLSGLGALLTPCVFSMIPITVSFFTKQSQTKAQGKRNAFVYSASIVGIFTFVGFLITLIWGAAALNNLATNWIANLLFFVLFLLFGISFLGAFEITLPSAWTNKASTKAGTGSFAGIFFMALVLVLVSFSCTGPFIGNLLPIIGKGGYFGPLVGFFSFSLALAIPFSLFAFFPGMMNTLGKPGGWLNAVKVTMGFVELALALKFLSNADLARGWRLLDREVFLSLWIVIFTLLGVYLLGKIRFHHDDDLPKNDFDLPYLNVKRLFFAVTAFAFALYMVPGLFGAPLKGISAFLPPMGTQDFIGSVTTSSLSASGPGNAKVKELQPRKYFDQMHIYEPEVVTKYGLVTYFDYNDALQAAREQRKPLMLDFTGINCVNCRKMEAQVWSDPEVMKRLKEDFVIVSLYVDVHNIDLSPAEQYYSKALDKQVETLGDKNADLQVTKFGANTQPYYFFLDGKENRLSKEGYGYAPDIKQFIQLLDDVKNEFQKRNKI